MRKKYEKRRGTMSVHWKHISYCCPFFSYRYSRGQISTWTLIVVWKPESATIFIWSGKAQVRHKVWHSALSGYTITHASSWWCLQLSLSLSLSLSFSLSLSLSLYLSLSHVRHHDWTSCRTSTLITSSKSRHKPNEVPLAWQPLSNRVQSWLEQVLGKEKDKGAAIEVPFKSVVSVHRCYGLLHVWGSRLGEFLSQPIGRRLRHVPCNHQEADSRIHTSRDGGVCFLISKLFNVNLHTSPHYNSFESTCVNISNSCFCGFFICMCRPPGHPANLFWKICNHTHDILHCWRF